MFCLIGIVGISKLLKLYETRKGLEKLKGINGPKCVISYYTHSSPFVNCILAFILL